VYVVGHEAVRNDFKRSFVRGAQNLRTHERDVTGVVEDALSLIRAERQRVVVLPGVGQVFLVRRVRVGHGGDRACSLPLFPLFRLKAEATERRSLPPEGGSHGKEKSSA
jgi:hypothetical protein